MAKKSKKKSNQFTKNQKQHKLNKMHEQYDTMVTNQMRDYNAYSNVAKYDIIRNIIIDDKKVDEIKLFYIISNSFEADFDSEKRVYYLKCKYDITFEESVSGLRERAEKVEVEKEEIGIIIDILKSLADKNILRFPDKVVEKEVESEEKNLTEE